MRRVLSQAMWIAVYDLKGLWRERGLAWLLVAALGLAVYGLGQGASAQAARLQASAAAESQAGQALAAAKAAASGYFADSAAPRYAGLKWWRVAFDIRGYAFREHQAFAVKPSLPGSALAIGQADLLPSYLRVRADSLEVTNGAYEIEHPARLAAGRFDLLFFVVYVWSLVLLAVGCTVLTLDRELKRLPLLKLQGASELRLLLTQILVRVLVATAALVAAVVLASLLTGAVPATGEGLAVLARWAGIVLLYSVFWALVIAAICARAAQRVTAAFAGFGAWVVLGVLLPTLLPAALSTLVPMPSREAYVEALRDAGDKVSPSLTRIARMQEQERLLEPMQRRFEAARRERDERFERWSAFSPVSLVHEALARLAGNDAQRHRRFLAEVAAHHAELRGYFQAQLQEAALRDERTHCPQTCRDGFGFDRFDEVPHFRAAAALTQATEPDVGALLLWIWLGLCGIVAIARRN